MLIRKSRVRLISMVPGARNGRKLVPLPPLFFFFYQETFQGTFSSLWCLFFSFIFWMTFLLTSTWCQTWSSIHLLSSFFSTCLRWYIEDRSFNDLKCMYESKGKHLQVMNYSDVNLSYGKFLIGQMNNKVF